MRKHYLVLLILTFLGGALRFYKLDWGSGFFFHPDERNIASAVLNLNPVKGDFNPNFFAYGSFPIYVTYAICAILSFLTKNNWLEFGKIILIGRGISATLSTLLIPLVYLVIKNVAARPWRAHSILAAAFTAFVPGLIQYAHFSTFETILTFEYLLALYFALKIAKHRYWRDYIFCAIVIGASVATKVTSLLIVPILLLTWAIGQRGQMGQIRKVVVSLFLITLTAFVLSPYNLLDFSSFRGAMDYEGGVASGSLPVFYTAQFIGTKPVWFQLIRVFPYILGWPLTVLSFLGWLGHLRRNHGTLLLLTIPSLYLVFHAALFVKWTRYMIPMLPFLIVMAVLFVSRAAPPRENPSGFFLPAFSGLTRRVGELAARILMISLIFVIVLQGLSFFSIYLHPDTRVAAAKWAEKNIPRNAKILSEVWDMGIIAFNPHFDNIELFNFYELDSLIDANFARMDANLPEADEEKIKELAQLLEESEYIIVPSQRIYGTRLRLPERFPVGARYYQTLFDGTLGFTKIAEFDSGTKRPPRSLDLTSEVKRIWFDEVNAEETFKVFDHPKVMIFEKVKPLTQTQYLNLLLR